MLTVGGSSGDQSPSLSRTETLAECATAASGRPSQLKSATTREVAKDPTAVVIGGPKLALPSPRRTVRPPTGSPWVTTRSSTPSPLTSAAWTEQGSLPAAKDCAGWKVPSPLPNPTRTVPPYRLVVARSSFPSALKSATARESPPTPGPGDSWNVPSPLPS